MTDSAEPLVLDLERFFRDYVDHLAPILDIYEQTYYLYIFRHSLFLAQRECVIGFKSARKKIGFGIGEAGAFPSEATSYGKLRSLESKRVIKLLGSERNGTRIKCFLPSEIPGLINTPTSEAAQKDIDELDFFVEPQLRETIFARDNNQCFYCRRILTEENRVIEHVVSRPAGSNSYKNLVASCRLCNNRKGETTAETLLRTLYREGILEQEELLERIQSLADLQAGLLRPVLPEMFGA